MRALLPALALALGMSITPASADEQLAAALESTGFFTGLDRAQTAALRGEIVGQGYTAAMARARRVAAANTQNFATGGVGAWVRNDIVPILATRGVIFRPAEDRLATDGSTYSVVIGTNEYTMWRAGETNPELAATVAAFAMVNSLLESVGAPERLYLIGEGAGGQAWLLSPAQAQIIRGVAPPETWPYLPGVEALPAAVVRATPAAAPSGQVAGALTPTAASAVEAVSDRPGPPGEALSSDAPLDQPH